MGLHYHDIFLRHQSLWRTPLRPHPDRHAGGAHDQHFSPGYPRPLRGGFKILRSPVTQRI